MNVKVAVVGAGSRGSKLIRALDGVEDCHIAQVCDSNFSRLLSVREWFPYIPVTATFDDLLTDSTLDAITITTPVSTHYQLALASLKAGKHVLVEAPMTLDKKQADELVTTAVAQAKVLAVGHTQLYHPAVEEMKMMLDLGQAGELYYMESSRMIAGTSSPEVNVIWDLAAHDVAIALYLAGERPVEVIAVGRDFTRPDIIDVAFITVKYESGRFSQHHVSRLSPHKVRRFFVAGSAGALVFSDNRQADKLRLFQPEEGLPDEMGDIDFSDAEGVTMALGMEAMLPPEQDRDESSLFRQCSDFISCIRNEQIPLASGFSGRDVVGVLEAADRSIGLGSIPINVTRET